METLAEVELEASSKEVGLVCLLRGLSFTLGELGTEEELDGSLGIVFGLAESSDNHGASEGRKDLLDFRDTFLSDLNRNGSISGREGISSELGRRIFGQRKRSFKYNNGCVLALPQTTDALCELTGLLLELLLGLGQVDDVWDPFLRFNR